MTLLSWLYLIPGLTTLVWPIIFVLFFKEVRPVQWLYSVAAIVIGVAIMLYSCLFNVNLRGEYFIVILYCVVALFAPGLFGLFINKLTNSEGASSKIRALFAVPIVSSLIIVGSAMVAGRDTYRQYMENVMYNSDPSLIGVFEYDQLVIIGKYFFLAVLLVQIVWVVFSSIRRLMKYFVVLDNYMAANGRPKMENRNRVMLIIMGVSVLFCAIVLVTNPVYELENVGLIVAVSVITSLVSLLLGFVVSAASYTAEEMNGMLDLRDRRLGNISWLGPREQLARYKELSSQMEEIVNHQKGFLDRKLSFDDVCSKIGADPLDLTEAIRLIHGCNFMEYVDSLRIDRAIALMLLQSEDDDALMLRYKVLHTDFVKNIALRCGFNNEDNLKMVFQKQMGQSILEWISEGIQ